MESYTCKCGPQGEFKEPKYITHYGKFCSNQCLEEMIEDIMGVSIKISGRDDNES